MIDDSEELERLGGYFLLRCDSAYAMFSGYEYIVCCQPPTLCQPKQLRGFPKSQLAQAKAFLNQKAHAGNEAKSFNRTEKRVRGNLDKGWLPCERGDAMSRALLGQRGFTFAGSTGSVDWYAPPSEVPTLFPTLPPEREANNG